MDFRFFYREWTRTRSTKMTQIREPPLNSQSAIIRTQNNDCWGRTTDPPLYNAASYWIDGNCVQWLQRGQNVPFYRANKDGDLISPLLSHMGGIAKVPTSQRSSILYLSLCLLFPLYFLVPRARPSHQMIRKPAKKDLFKFDARRERQSVLVQNYIIYCCFECNLYNSFTFMSVLCLLSVNNDQSAAINVRLAMHIWWCYLEITLITGTTRTGTFARARPMICNGKESQDFIGIWVGQELEAFSNDNRETR